MVFTCSVYWLYILAIHAICNIYFHFSVVLLKYLTIGNQMNPSLSHLHLHPRKQQDSCAPLFSHNPSCRSNKTGSPCEYLLLFTDPLKQYSATRALSRPSMQCAFQKTKKVLYTSVTEIGQRALALLRLVGDESKITSGMKLTVNILFWATQLKRKILKASLILQTTVRWNDEKSPSLKKISNTTFYLCLRNN